MTEDTAMRLADAYRRFTKGEPIDLPALEYELQPAGLDDADALFVLALAEVMERRGHPLTADPLPQLPAPTAH